MNRVLKSTSYSANIHFTKTEVYVPADRNGRAIDSDAPGTRETVESRVTVRAPFLAKLQEKVTAHVALLDDADLTEES